MSEDSGSAGRTQRTVAELLAQYGGGPGVGTPRRRRRRADDDTGESAPQTIIDRVLSDSGRLRAIRDEQDTGVGGGRAPESEPARRQQPYQDPGTSGRSRRPAMDQAPPPSAPVRRVAPPPMAPAGRPGAPVPPAGKKPTPATGPTTSSSTPPPPDALADTTQVPPVRGGFPRTEQQPPTGNRLPHPERRRRPAAVDQGTQMLRPEPEPRDGFDDQGTQVLRPEVEPQAGFGGFSDQGTQVLRPDQAGPLPQRGRPGAAPQASQSPQAPAGGEGWTEQIPRIDVSALEGEEDDESAAPQPPYPAAGRFGEGPGPRVAADEPPAGLGGPPTEQWFDEELAGALAGYDAPEAEAFEDEDDPDAERFEDADELEDDEAVEDLEDLEDLEEEPKGSSVKEWLVTLGQLGVGLIGGGGLWLAFQWLWQSLPAVAMVVALVVTVGLVLVVRLVRKAEDLQTTVLAILVGVVVTMSPAALLLVER